VIFFEQPGVKTIPTIHVPAITILFVNIRPPV
jgi:hypothetical protein